MTEKTWGQGCVILVRGKTRNEMAKLLRIEDVIHRGLRPLWIPPFLICRILHILLSLIRSIIAKYPFHDLNSTRLCAQAGKKDNLLFCFFLSILKTP